MGFWTLVEIFHRCAGLVEPIYAELMRLVAADRVVHADETSLKQQRDEKLTFVSTFACNKAITYVFSRDRSGETPQRVLGDSQGFLVVDDYTGCNAVTTPARRIRAGCTARPRKFVDVEDPLANDCAIRHACCFRTLRRAGARHAHDITASRVPDRHGHRKGGRSMARRPLRHHLVCALTTLVALSLFAGSKGGCINVVEPVCTPGTIADAQGNCVPGCLTTSDCPGGQICGPATCDSPPCANRCGNPTCSAPQMCMKGGYCDLHEGVCKPIGFCQLDADCLGQPLPLPDETCEVTTTCVDHQCKTTCTGPLDPCKAVNAWEFGDCFGIVGVSWDGRTCGLQSGCGCDPKTELSCRRLASTLAECEQKTATCPLAPFSWYKQCNTPACTVAFKLPAGVEYCKGAREGSPCTVEGALCASCGLSMVCAKSDPKLQSCPQ